jgi:signal transduction histidine kinase
MICKVLDMKKEINKFIMKDSQYSDEETKICLLLNEIITDKLSEAKAKNITLIEKKQEGKCDSCNKNLQLNKGLLYLLFSNIISNAIIHSPENSKVTIVYAHVKDKLVTTVENSGTITKEILDSFFDKDVKSNESKGTGFGTYCSKLLANLCKGDITVSNDDNKVKVAIELPI